MLLAGVSPSASLKRDKLLQRNAILRRTGFIEAGGSPLLPGARPLLLQSLRMRHMHWTLGLALFYVMIQGKILKEASTFVL